MYFKNKIKLNVYKMYHNAEYKINVENYHRLMSDVKSQNETK